MNRDTVLFAVVEAERFIKGAKRVMRKREEIILKQKEIVATQREEIGIHIKGDNKDTAALRRVSMDLTRALANMRKPF